MTRLQRAVFGQLAGVVLAASAWVFIYPPLGLLTLGASLVWWFRDVYQIEESG